MESWPKITVRNKWNLYPNMTRIGYSEYLLGKQITFVMVPSGRERAQINDMVKYNLGQYQLKVIPEVLRYGTIHKGRPQNFQDFQPPLPPLSAFHATYQYYLSPKSGNSQPPLPPSVRTSFMYGPYENPSGC